MPLNSVFLSLPLLLALQVQLSLQEEGIGKHFASLPTHVPPIHTIEIGQIRNTCDVLNLLRINQVYMLDEIFFEREIYTTH